MLAYAAYQTPNVVEATNTPGLFSKLEDIQSRCAIISQHHFHTALMPHTHLIHLVFLCRLALCEKALTEYLDTKRLAFPRFYFISSADLLDILSNGTNPHQVAMLIYAWQE